jgi:metallo-beta-lactamase family protein
MAGVLTSRENAAMDRRRFLRKAGLLGGGVLLGVAGCGPQQATIVPAPAETGDGGTAVRRKPRLTFCGSNRQVSGSCHLLETSAGLFLIDCGLFYADVEDQQKRNEQFPFEPKDIKAVFLTHAHVDHNGRLPLLYKRGFRGPVYCTDATRDINEVMLDMSLGIGEGRDDSPLLYDRSDLDGLLDAVEAVPYNRKLDKNGLTFRLTDAGHILGSAMVEVWADGVKFLFSGDMGPDHTPVLCRPAQHLEADVVLVESTYGLADREQVSYEDFGRQVMKVISASGSVLLPAFVLHKTQMLLYVINRLKDDRVIDRDVPVYADSSTAQKVTRLYSTYREYYGPEARVVEEPFRRWKTLETKVADSLASHGRGPAIYVSSSGMLDHAAAPKHLVQLADDPKNAVFIVGWQAPASLGKRLYDHRDEVPRTEEVPWEDWKAGKLTVEMKKVEVRLRVDKVGGFSSHARGWQIKEWLEGFRRVGAVYVVHGEEANAVGLDGFGQIDPGFLGAALERPAAVGPGPAQQVHLLPLPLRGGRPQGVLDPERPALAVVVDPVDDDRDVPGRDPCRRRLGRAEVVPAAVWGKWDFAGPPAGQRLVDDRQRQQGRRDGQGRQVN